VTDKKDRELGMEWPIHRRDFLQGTAVTAATLAMASQADAQATPGTQDTPGYYPPLRNGLRGSHPGAFETAHSLRDGTFWDHAEKPEDAHRVFDLIVVGAGISGLSAAHFFRKAKPNARILILDNHDDFGGHAKRNEFQIGGHTLLLNGGTQLIDSPRPYSKVAAGLMTTLGIDPEKLADKCDRPDDYKGLLPSTFFDKETFGQDKLVVGRAREMEGEPGGISWADFLAKCPLSKQGQADILRVAEGTTDYMAGMSEAQKKDKLSRISYLDYLKNYVKCGHEALAFYQTISHDEYGVGIDAEPALDCWGFHYPGFSGLKLSPKATARMGNTAAGYVENPDLTTFHFPDGNATIARLLVRNLIPAAMPGHTVEDVVMTRANYAELNRAGAPINIRLSCTVVGAKNIGDAQHSKGVEVAYARAGKIYRVQAANCVMASWNMMIPYIVPELPDAQKAALHQLVKTPLVYASVAIRNSHAFHKLGAQGISAPGGYFVSARLNFPVDVGGYKTTHLPDDPALVYLVRTPCQPGLSEEDQYRSGRMQLLQTSFEDFERAIRDQMNRMLKGGGFDSARDIAAITVNRWPHGYACEFNPLFDNFDIPPEKMANVVGRQRFGRITIANSDAGASAYTDSAIDQAHRAVGELLAI
jgi:spermidine dehydrogenase